MTDTALQKKPLRHHTNKQAKKPPLRKIVGFLSVGTMLVTIAIILPICLMLISAALSSAIQETMAKDVQAASSTLDEWLLSQKYLVQASTEELQATYKGDSKQIAAFLNQKAILPSNSQTNTLYVGLKNGEFYEAYGQNLPEGVLCTDRNWYKQAAASDGMIVTNPYEDVIYGGTVVTIATKIEQYGEVIGVLGADVRIDNIQKYIVETVDENGAYFFLVSESGEVLLHRDDYFRPTDGKFKNLAEITDNGYGKLPELLSQDFTARQGFQIKNLDGSGKFVRFAPLKYADWTVIVLAPTTTLTFYVYVLAAGLIGLVLVFAVCSIFAIKKVSKRYFSPFEAITARLISLSNCDIYADVQINANSLEVAQIYDATQTIQSFLQRYISEISKVLGSIADSNLQVRLENDYAGDFSDIKTALLQIIRSLSTAIQGIQQASRQVSVVAGEVAGGAQSLSQGTNQQASATEALLTSLSTISAQVDHNAQNAKLAATFAQDATAEVASGNRQMTHMVAAMENISVKSSEIGKIIKTIDSIAFQTNILALNAAVEAARAGAAGKGFAVVADEVRNLANKSAQAAKNTALLIEESISAVESGGKIAKSTAQSLTAIVEMTAKINSLIGEIAAATGEQATGIGQINASMEQISAIVQTNSSTAEQSAALGEELSSQSNVLENLTLQFKIFEEDQSAMTIGAATPVHSDTAAH